MAQVSENRSKLRDAVMHDDIIREKGRLLKSRECGMRDVGNTKRAWKGPERWNMGWKFTLTPLFHENSKIFAFFKSIFSYLMCNVKTVCNSKLGYEGMPLVTVTVKKNHK